MINSLEFLFQSLRDWSVFAVWQSTLILGLAILSEGFLRRSPWQANLLLTLAIPGSLLAPTVSLFVFYGSGGVIAPGLTSALEKQAESVGAFFGLGVLIGGPLFLTFFLYSIIAARRLMFQARPFPDRESQEALLEGSRMMRNVSLPILFTSSSVKSPTVWSWGLHPAVLLPETLVETLSPEERDGIFLHELAHTIRRDHWSAFMVRFCGVFLFWNPLYWLAVKRGDLAADQACDLLVLSYEKVSPEVYGETLLRLAAGEKNRPVLQYLSRKEQLMKRIDTILDFEENRNQYSVARTALKTLPLTLAVLVLATALAFCQEKKKEYPFTAPENRLTHLVSFEPAEGFEPKIFDELYEVLNPAMTESGVKWMFTKMERDKDGKQIFLCLTDDPEKVEAVIDSLPQLKFVKSQRLTKESYKKHTATWKNRMKKPADGGYATPKGGYTHLVVFEANVGFSPKGPMDYLNLVNPKLNEFGVHCGYFRTKAVDDKLIAFNATDTPEEYKQLVESISQLKYLETRRLTKEMFEEYEKTAQESLSSRRLRDAEKSGWFQKLNDFQKRYVRWDEKQFLADYSLTLPENENERKALEERWAELLEGEEPVRTEYDGTDEFTKAIVGLAMLKSPKAKKLLANLTGERVVKDNAYRHTATKMLGELGDPAAIPDLIPLVYHFNFNTRVDAQISLVRLSGQNFGNDVTAWAIWYNDHRDKLGKDLPEFDPTPVDWSCGEDDPEIRFYCDPKNQKNMDDAWLRRQGGKAKTSSKSEKSVESPSRPPIWFLGQEAQDRPPHIEVWNGKANMMTMIYAMRLGGRRWLELTEEQQKKLGFLGKQQEFGVEWFQKMHNEQNAELIEAEEAARALIPSDDPQFEKATEEQKRAYVEAVSKPMIMFYRSVQNEINETLTPEQLKKLRSLEFTMLPETVSPTPHMFDSLGLTEEQQKKVEAIKKEFEPEFLKLLDEQMELRKEHLVLYTQGKNSDADREEYNLRFGEQIDRLAEFTKRLKERLEKDVLTEEQRTETKKLADELPGSMKQQFYKPEKKTAKESLNSPQVVKFEPALEAKEVDPESVTEIRVIFDQDMSRDGYSWCGGPPLFPETTDKPRWIDKRTCVLPVKLEEKRLYRLAINGHSAQNFKSRDGVPATITPYFFSTKGYAATEPKVVKMEPENGAKNVDAEKTTELRVSFDIDMSMSGFSWCGGGETFPETTGKPRWIDKRTCVLPVKLLPGKEYQLSINARRFKNFRSADGVPVEPVPYSFSTRE